MWTGIWLADVHSIEGKEKAILSLTTKPTAPMIRKPTPTAWQIFKNSFRSAAVRFASALELLYSIGARKRLTLLAPVDELHAIFQELSGHVEDFL